MPQTEDGGWILEEQVTPKWLLEALRRAGILTEQNA